MKFFVGLIASLAILLGLFELREGSRDLNITRTIVGETPMTIFRPQSAAPAPVVVIAHGFAGSQQLMQPFAETLARNGYMAVTFDFLGHGRNPIPMHGDITEGLTITNALLKELTDVAAAARQLPGSDGRLAVLGHSMASDIVVRFAQAHADVEATVAVSVFSPVVTPTSPRNLRWNPGCCGTKACASSISPLEGRRDPARPMADFPMVLRESWCWRAVSSISGCSTVMTA
jgi:alpha-beta hydrolase superfamily lysophospholipase